MDFLRFREVRCWVEEARNIHELSKVKVYRNGAFKEDVHFSISLTYFLNIEESMRLKTLMKMAFLRLGDFDFEMFPRLYSREGDSITSFNQLRGGNIYFMTIFKEERLHFFFCLQIFNEIYFFFSRCILKRFCFPFV